MAADAPREPQPAPVPDAPRVIITFAGRGSSACRIEAPGIDPGQLYLAAWLLDALAHETRQGQLIQEQAAAIPNLQTVLEQLKGRH